jgi:hypothetical protein|tara:strand:- start:360 stop:596 length:237 start_codon:yes stop_codon:yes gene_type:complete
MFNPFVDNLSSLSDIEVENKLIELQRKYFMTHNSQVQMQMSSIISMYQEEMSSRRAKQYQQQQQQNGEKGLDSLINIS